MRAGMQRPWVVVAILFVVTGFAPVHAGTCDKPVGRLVSLQGVVEARGADQTTWQAARLQDGFCPGDAIRTGARSRAALVLSNETIVRLDQLTTLTLSGLDDPAASWIDLLTGAAHFLSRTPRALKIKTPYVNAGIEGTEFVVRVTEDEGRITVLEGRVRADNPQGEIVLGRGESAAARAGQAPAAHVLLQPRDAVQWALYYPPLFDRQALTGETTDWAEAARRSLSAYEAGDVAGAFAAIAAVPETIQDTRLSNHRAALLLTVGRLDEAQAALERSLQVAAGNAHALALQAIVALARNDKPRALELARQATAQDARSAPAWAALSYAQQAGFDIEGARASIERALAVDAADALAWARLSELWLSLGDLDHALEAAHGAARLNPNVARTQTVLGFAHLTRIKIADARQAFEKAIALDSADPLPRLGLGLALIRSGALDAGRRELEIAAALDPNNALIRSYLGKAYYEEKRNRLAATQLDMAKLLDPNDPTPWFYDAIRKQTENRPVEALSDLQKSTDLNDNRAVYRSKLQLDQDLAARSVSKARVYQDLGFQQRALTEGFQSATTDPANDAAHRFLAESYSALQRHEIGRASEALQAQLLQPLNVNLVSPQASERNLTALEGSGPSTVGHNEFNPLFVRDRETARLSGVGGSHDTWGDELVAGGLRGGVAYSIGQYHYQTEGFRDNNDLEQNLYNGFVQVALSPSSSLQFEARTREQENGDLRMRMDPTKVSTTLREKRDDDTLRLGYHQHFSPGSDLIVSLIQGRIGYSMGDSVNATPTIRIENSTQTMSDAYNGELQFLSHFAQQKYLVGAGYYDGDVTQSAVRKIVNRITGATLSTLTTTRDLPETHSNAYVYSYLSPFQSLVLTFGASVDYFETSYLYAEQVNPKVGFMWTPVRATTVRAAAFRTLKRSLVSSQTIEPSQVAGFAQFFDDVSGVDSWRYGIGLDQRFGNRVFAGLEATQRDLEVPKVSGTTTLTVSRYESQRELAHRLYVYWMPIDRVSFAAEYFFENLSRDREGFADFNFPDRVKTHRAPFTVGYYDPGGVFARLRGTYYDQLVVQATSLTTTTELTDDFWVTDLELGYRLPRRLGIASLEVRNLFDKEFLYEGVDFQTGIARESPIQPGRSVFVNLTLGF
jgi:tetratricopeptide (TPR) repeat protein